MSTHSHEHSHHLHAAEKQDLTRTTTLHRRDFLPALMSRFDALRGAIRTTVGYENDALGLRQGVTAAADDIDDAEMFMFTSDAEAQDAFMEWLQTQLDQGVLERTPRGRVRRGEHWTARYDDAAYQRGLDDAVTRLRANGVEVAEARLEGAFNLPIHQDTLEGIYTRTYDELDGITSDMADSVRRELATALELGENPEKAARRLTGAVSDMDRTRARRLSRTEISNAYNTASAKRYERFGVEEVNVLTSAPCPKCATLASGNPHPVEQASTLIPGRTHPQCVCTIAPNV